MPAEVLIPAPVKTQTFVAAFHQVVSVFSFVLSVSEESYVSGKPQTPLAGYALRRDAYVPDPLLIFCPLLYVYNGPALFIDPIPSQSTKCNSQIQLKGAIHQHIPLRYAMLAATVALLYLHTLTHF